MKKLLALLFIAGSMAYAALSGAQDAPAQPFIVTACSASATCCAVAVPQFTQPVPGGTPTTVNGPAPILYGIHVTNQGAANSFLQLFNAAATPAAAATPLGASSWSVGAASDRDVSIGEMMGWAFNLGIQACCSSTQGTFTAVGSCGFVLETR